MYPTLRNKCAVHSSGEVQVGGNNESILVENILHDTESISTNYINLHLVDTYRKELENKIRKKTQRVRLAEKDNTVETTEEITMTICFTDETDKKRVFKYTGNFIVLDIDGNGAIIGVPAILGELFDFFITMLTNAREKSMKKSEFVVNNMVGSVNNDLIDAWSYPIEGPAPEEN
jgi:hypothetical protein